MAKKTPVDKRINPGRVARDLYGELLGATRADARNAAMTDFAELDPGEQRFVQTQLTYLLIREVAALRRVAEDCLPRLERWAQRHDQRETMRDHGPEDDDDDDDEGAEDVQADEDLEAAPASGGGRRAAPPLPPKGTRGALPPIDRTCPTCGAKPGSSCVTGSGKTTGFHAARTADPTAAPAATGELLNADGTRAD